MADIDGRSVTFAADRVEGSGWLARPRDGATHPGVIVIQEWWGLDAHIKDVAGRVAGEGFVALAPDLYHGAFATEPDEARKLAMAMNRERAIDELAAAVRHLQSLDDVQPKRVGCMGFCMGGSLTYALAAATADIAAAAPFYGGMTPPPEQLAGIEAELFCAYGADDGGIPLERVREIEETLRAANRRFELKVYEGAPHSFFNDTRPSYRPEAARDAWDKTIALFRRALV